ncbi:MAG: YqiJ family protein [Methylobacteriaceae bacterium]|jgi:membrane protein implicated in regulation of membrane protease activity|nr:YqiJ family protein [Methylobacteriaceae bacterium]
MELLLSDQLMPFAVATGIMLSLIVLELVSLLIGLSISGSLDSLVGIDTDVDLDVGALDHGFLAAGFSWLNAGRVPFIALLIIFLGIFSMSGFALQSVCASILQPLPAWIAALSALFVTVPLTRQASRLAERIIPHDETYATTTDALIGRTGIVTLGPVREGFAARIKIQDQFQNWHFPRARPATPDEVIEQGELALVVDCVGQEVLVARAAGDLRPSALNDAKPS